MKERHRPLRKRVVLIAALFVSGLLWWAAIAGAIVFFAWGACVVAVGSQ